MTELNGVPDYFDRHMHNLQGAPNTVHTKELTKQVVGVFGLGSHAYIVQTFRQAETGDTIFLQDVAGEGVKRVVIPPEIAEVIARQRDQLSSKNRKLGAAKAVQTRKELGIEPGFLKNRKKKT